MSIFLSGLASSNHSIEFKKQKFELPNTDIFKCHVEDSFTSNSEHSETNLNDTLENVENLLSHGIKYMLTDDNGIDVSHLLPDGCGIYDKKASQNEDPKLPSRYIYKIVYSLLSLITPFIKVNLKLVFFNISCFIQMIYLLAKNTSKFPYEQ